MDSETVYQVAKALPLEEQLLLFDKLKKDFYRPKMEFKRSSKVLTRELAIDYLLSNVFNKKRGY